MKKPVQLAMAFVAAILAFGAGPAAASPQASGQSSDEHILIDVGVVSSIDDIEVPARVKGFIRECLVEEGDEVQPRQTLASLDTTSIEHEMGAAKIRRDNARRQADDTTPVEYARATLDVAIKELEINEGLYRRDALPLQELERSRLSRIQAELQVKRSLAQQSIDQGSVDLEEQSIAAVEELMARHTITAPIAGQIVRLNRRAGEYVQEGETLLRLVDLSQVKVEGSVDAARVNPDQLFGRPVVVRLRLANDEEVTFAGEVKSLGLNTLEPSTYLVQATVDNQKRGDQWLLRPNSRVQIEVMLAN